MRITPEVRRTVAQFLNGVAVAVLVAGVIAPLATGAIISLSMAIATVGALAFHAIALAILVWS